MISTVRIWVDKIISNPMVEGRRTRALARAIKWQLGKRLGFGRALVEIGPAHIYCYPGHAAASGALYTGFMEWDEMSFTVRFLRADDHFVDVGANVGTSSVFAAAFAPGVRVTSVEPGDAARRRLTENLALNGLAVDRVVSSAIGPTQGHARFTIGQDTLNSLAEDVAPDTVEVDVTTLDALTAGDRPALVKIDVEGAELEVLKGAIEVLRSKPSPTLIMELNGLCERFGASPTMIRDHLARFGYTLYEYDGRSNELTPFTADGLPDSKNVIATNDVDGVRKRLNGDRNWQDLSNVPISARLQRV